jgi:hypothetical protein
MNSDVSLTTSFAAVPIPKWSLRGDGHVIAASIIEDSPNVEARILLDGRLLYRSRHNSRAAAEQELVALRGHWAREGWIDTV